MTTSENNCRALYHAPCRKRVRVAATKHGAAKERYVCLRWPNSTRDDKPEAARRTQQEQRRRVSQLPCRQTQAAKTANKFLSWGPTPTNNSLQDLKRRPSRECDPKSTATWNQKNKSNPAGNKKMSSRTFDFELGCFCSRQQQGLQTTKKRIRSFFSGGIGGEKLLRFGFLIAKFVNLGTLLQKSADLETFLWTLKIG